MKNKVVFSIAIVLLITIALAVNRKAGIPSGSDSSVQSAASPGISFYEGSWNEVLKKAQESNKPIMVDLSTSWCGWCKRMKKNTFTDKATAEYYNANFINVELDAEQGDGLTLAQKYQVQSYPTIIYLDKNEKLILFAEGYMGPDDFIKAGKAAFKNIK